MGDQVGEKAGDQRSTQNCYVEMIWVDQKKARLNSIQGHSREQVQVMEEGLMGRVIELELENA